MDINHLQNASDQAVGHINHLNCQIDPLTEINGAFATEKAILCSWWDEGTLRTSYRHEIQNTESKKRSEQEAEISYLKESLILKEEEMYAAQSWSQQKYDIMVARYEAERQVSAPKTQMCEVQSTDEYQSNMNYVQEELHHKNNTILDLSQRLSKKHAELAQKQQDWVEKEELMQGNIDRLGDEKKAMAVKFGQHLSQKQGEFMAIMQNVTREWNQQEDKIHQRDAKIVELSKEKECLEAQAKREQDWATQHKLRQGNIDRLGDEKKAMVVKFENSLSKKQDEFIGEFLEIMQNATREWNQQEDKIHQRDAKIVELSKEKECLEAQAKREQDWVEKEELMQGNIDRLGDEKKAMAVKFGQHLSQKQGEFMAIMQNVTREWNQQEDKIHQRDAKIVELSKEKECLEAQAKREQDWATQHKLMQGNIDRLGDEKKAMVVEFENSPSKKQDEFIGEFLEIMQNATREWKKQEDKIYRRDVKIVELLKEKECLEAQAKREQDWVEKEELMQGNIDRLGDEKKAMAVEFENNLSKKQGELMEIMQHVTRELKQQEDKIYQRDVTIVELLKEKECLHQKLTETTDKLIHKEAEVLQKSSGARMPEPEPDRLFW